MIFVCAASALTAYEPSLDDVWKVLKEKKFVDLTHAFEPGIPHWKGFPDTKHEAITW